VRRALAAAIAFPVVVMALHLLGVAGYQAGEALTAVALAAAAIALTLFAAGARRGRVRLLALPLGAAALLLVAPLHEAAPLSKGRLVAALDELELPDFEVVSTELSGRSWCRPTCPVVVRRFAAPGIAPAAALALVAAELVDERLVPRSELALTRRTTELEMRGEALDARIAAAPSGTKVEVVLRVEARR
jgi:hypothetical protein